MEHRPTEIWIVARLAGALLATAAVGLVYAAGARWCERRTGLIAAALLATSFLPVHYGHLALNDAPMLAPLALALFVIAGVLRFGRARDYALASLALGLGIGLKYTPATCCLRCSSRPHCGPAAACSSLVAMAVGTSVVR